jgi:O-antigen/teichoic acid export membrane protein
MNNSRSSYRQIVKATSLFGGVQVFNIIISIVRSKFVALFLGPSGMGIVSLLTTTTSLISGLTNFGLGVSAVKDIASANEAGNKVRIATVIIVFKRWMWVTGTIGTLCTLFLAPMLSQWTFGNRDYTLAFIWLSITLLFTQLSAGQLAILQGMRKLQYLAKANIIGSAIGLFVTVPLYFIYGINAVVPLMILASVVSLWLSWYFANKVKILNIRVSKIRTIAEGKNMVLLGFVMSLSNLMALGASYVVRLYIGGKGGVTDVGLYSAGFTIINTYTGLIFSALLTDYFPRLSAVSHSNHLCNEAINQQAEITILILAPILVVFLVFIKWIIILLYSNQFTPINDMIYWAAMGMFFKASCWAIGLIFIVKGDSKLFFWSELIGNTYMLVLNFIGYHFWGLTGMGISFMVGYFILFIQTFFICRIRYNFNFIPEFLKIFAIQFFIAISAFFAIKCLVNPFVYIMGTLLIGLSTWYSVNELNERIGIKDLILSAIKKVK